MDSADLWNHILLLQSIAMSKSKLAKNVTKWLISCFLLFHGVQILCKLLFSGREIYTLV